MQKRRGQVIVAGTTVVTVAEVRSGQLRSHFEGRFKRFHNWTAREENQLQRKQTSSLRNEGNSGICSTRINHMLCERIQSQKDEYCVIPVI